MEKLHHLGLVYTSREYIAAKRITIALERRKKIGISQTQIFYGNNMAANVLLMMKKNRKDLERKAQEEEEAHIILEELEGKPLLKLIHNMQKHAHHLIGDH